MISLPMEIVHMIKTIEDAGFEAYAVGGCVRDSLLGRLPEDWDLTSNASRDTLEALFPDAAIINQKLGVMRITEGEITADLAAFRIDGEYKDYRRPETVVFTGDLMEDLRRRDFTMNAIAVNPFRDTVDPYHGILDIENRLIRGVGNPLVRFEEDALRILRGIRFSAQLDFRIHEDTLRAMKEKSKLLDYISIERIGEEFFKTVLSQNCGKGLKAFLETETLQFILGADCMKAISEEELKNLMHLWEHIDQTPCQLKFRLPMIYLCFEKEKALKSIEYLGHSNEMKKLLHQAVSNLEEFDKIKDRLEVKNFMGRFGKEGFRYFSELSVEHDQVLGAKSSDFQREHRNRTELFEEVLRDGEPVFPEDLAIDGNDLKELGIPAGRELGAVLKELLGAVRKNPKLNEKSQLLDLASKQKNREK